MRQRKKTMFQTVIKIGKWVLIPAILLASIFSRAAAGYELTVDLAVCLAAVIFVQRAVRVDEYFWAAGCVAIAIVFSPLLLVVKVFAMLGLTCVAAFVTLLPALRAEPLPV
jgi:hypothetical protein